MQISLRRRHLVITLICALVLAVFFVSDWRGYLWPRRLDLAFRDLVMREGRMLPKDDRLVFLAIDEASLTVDPLDLETLYSSIPRDSADYRALSQMTKAYPWSREVYAVALDKLVAAGASIVAFDLLFTLPESGDAVFREALDRHRDRVIVPSNFETIFENEREKISLTMPNEALIPAGSSMDSRAGFITVFASPYDGVSRDAQFRVWNGQLNNLPYKRSDEIFVSLSNIAATKVGKGDNIPPGFKPTIIRFAGPAGTFLPRSLFEIFVPTYWARNYDDGKFWKDKIVVIGTSAERNHDFLETPFGKARPMPGPEFHVQAINAALLRGYLSESPPWFERLALLLTAATVVGASFISASPLRRFLFVLGNGLLAVGAAVIAYNYFDFHLATANPLLSLGLCGLGAFAVDFTTERLERARTRREFEQYMSANVVRAVLDNPNYAREVARGFRKGVTILFSDIRGFTSMTESTDPHALVTQLNEYLGEMVKCVFQHNGTLDKFVGDAVMAVWGNTPVTKGAAGDAADAVRAATDMLAALDTLNAGWRADGRKTLEIGIGINHGDVIVGNMGSAQKKELTVIGDAVNLASRLEGLTKDYGVPLLIGESVAALLDKTFVLQPVDFAQVKGKSITVAVYTVLGEERDGLRERELAAGLTQYLEGLEQYRNHNAAGALAALSQAIALRPQDVLVRRYFQLAEKRLAEGVTPKWEEDNKVAAALASGDSNAGLGGDSDAGLMEFPTR